MALRRTDLDAIAREVAASTGIALERVRRIVDRETVDVSPRRRTAEELRRAIAANTQRARWYLDRRGGEDE